MSARVAITGMGVVSPLGCDLGELRNRLLEGVGAAGPITVFDPAELVVFLLSDRAGYVTGGVHHVDGGYQVG